jgi:ankyrin repeat protein
LATSYFNGFSDPEVLRLLVSLGISVDIVGGDERRTPMTLAIMEEALDDVTMLLECGADPSRRDVNRRGWCPFLRACVVGNVAIARCLLSAGATWNCAEYFPDERKERNPLFGGESRSAGPLQLACIGGHYEMVEQILQWMEESIERLECSDGPSALLWASRAGAKSIVSLLIEHGLPIDAVDPVDGYTALHAASAYGNTAVAQLLMSAGCVTNITDNCLRSARMHALDGNHLHLAQILDSSLDDDRMFTSMLNQRIHATPESASFARHANARGLNSHYIIAAIERGDIETVRRMCNAGGDMSRPFSCCSCTPLLLSIYLCQYEIAMQLLEYGVDGEGSMCGKHGVQGRNIYHLAATRADALQILEKLLDSSTVNGKLKAELPVMLRLAARRGNSLALARLIDLNEAQNPQALKLKGRLPASYSFNDDVVQCGTALHFAAGWAHERAAKILLDVGAPIEEADNRMRTALHVAILTSSISIIHVLLDAGANIHAIDYAGSSALHLAVRVGPVTIVDELLKRGAEISTHDDHGLSALAIASCCRDMGVVQLLLRDGNHVQELEDTAYLVSMISGSRWAGCSLALNLGSALNGCDYLWGWEDIEASRLRKLLRRLHAPSLLRNLMASKVKLISCGHLGPLDEACDRGRIEVAVVLLEAGAFVNLECGPSGTPLLHACRAGRFGIVRILIRRGAVISYKRGSEIISALHAAKHFPEIVQWILVERFIDQQKIEKCSSTQRAKFVLRAGSSTKKSYAPATSAKEVPWDTRKVMTRTEADRFLPQKLREMSSGPFVAREDGYVERLETG